MSKHLSLAAVAFVAVAALLVIAVLADGGASVALVAAGTIFFATLAIWFTDERKQQR